MELFFSLSSLRVQHPISFRGTINNYKQQYEVQGITKPLVTTCIFLRFRGKNRSNAIYDSKQFFMWYNSSIQMRGRGNTDFANHPARIDLIDKSAGSRNARTIMTRRIEASFLSWSIIQSPVLRFPVFRIAGGITTWEAGFSHVLLGRSSGWTWMRTHTTFATRVKVTDESRKPRIICNNVIFNITNPPQSRRQNL